MVQDLNRLLQLNVTLSKENGNVIVIISKRATINEANREAWMQLFGASLRKEPIKINAILEIPRELEFKCRLKEVGLVQNGVVCKV